MAHAYRFQDGGERQSGNVISNKKGKKGRRDTMTIYGQLFLEAGLSSELHLFSDPVEFKCLLP